MLLAQVTDLHISEPGTLIDRIYRTAAHLERAVGHLLALDPRPDAVLATGDLVEAGGEREYARLVEILAPLPMPVYVIPGNHDEREGLRRAFGARGYLPERGFLCYAVDLGPLRLIALDTNVPGSPGGELCGERLAWLDARLREAPDRPTILFQHHPPFLTGMSRMDEMSLEGRDGEAAVVSRHAQVERILCGHLHRPIVRRFAGTVAATCPSTAHQVDLDLRARGHLALVREPPAVALHLWSQETGLVSHTSYVGDYGGADVMVPAG